MVAKESICSGCYYPLQAYLPRGIHVAHRAEARQAHFYTPAQMGKNKKRKLKTQQARETEKKDSPIPCAQMGKNKKRKLKTQQARETEKEDSPSPRTTFALNHVLLMEDTDDKIEECVGLGLRHLLQVALLRASQRGVEEAVRYETLDPTEKKAEDDRVRNEFLFNLRSRHEPSRESRWLNDQRRAELRVMREVEYFALGLRAFDQREELRQWVEEGIEPPAREWTQTDIDIRGYHGHRWSRRLLELRQGTRGLPFNIA